MLSNKKWAGIFAACAALGLVFRLTDMQLAQALYSKGSIFGGFCENIAAALPPAFCCFASAAMMACRRTRTTRAKNRALNVFFAVLSFVFALAAAYYPYRNVEKVNYILVAAVAVVLTGTCIYVNFTAFKETYQKIVMTNAAKVALLSAAAVVLLCAAGTLIPQRPSYSAVQLSIERFGSAKPPYESTVTVLPFAGAASAMSVLVNFLPKVLPKLRFSSKLVFALSLAWTAVIVVGAVSSGNVYASEMLYGAAAGYLSVFAASKIIEKHEDRL